MTLRISEDFELPDGLVTETVAILGKRGTGKSNAAVVMAEQMWNAGLQWVALDPKGDWWGVRSGADGEGPGLPIPIFGGLHGDLPLEASSGALMARLIVERDLTCVLDVSSFSKGDQIRFATDFATTLFEQVRLDPRVLHMFLEEAEEFLPQRVEAKAARMVGACSKISKQGRAFGLGVTLITQRSASLNKDALSQTDTLILFRTVSPHDRKAVEAWADHHLESREIAESLSSLKAGESWILSPGFLQVMQRVQWVHRSTFDSGATPKAGDLRRSKSVALADIDLGEISTLMTDTIEHAEAVDPVKLRRKLQAAQSEVAVLKRERDAWEQRAVEAADAAVAGIDPEFAATLAGSMRSTVELVESLLTEIGGQVSGALAEQIESLSSATPVSAPAVSTAPARRLAPLPAPAALEAPDGAGGDKLSKAERSILSALAEDPGTARSKQALGMLAGYSSKGGGFNNALSSLRGAGLIERGDPIRVTADGLIAVAGSYEPLPTGRALVDMWAQRQGKAGNLILTALADAWPSTMSKQALADATGYSPKGGGFNNALSRLRTLGLITGSGEAIAAADNLMEG